MQQLAKLPEHRHRWYPCRITTAVPICLVLTVTLSILFMMKEAPDAPIRGGGDEESPTPTRTFFKYDVVPGYFLQDDAKTDASTFDFKKHNFGLVDRSYDNDSSLDLQSPTLWQRFAHHVFNLNSAAPPSISYRLLFLGRHGQGYHNVAESYYGLENWDCYWSLLDGNGTATWADAHLTELGIGQAQDVHDFWKDQIKNEKIATPQAYYVSPLDRAINTADITFRGLNLGDRPYKPLIKEMLREGNGLHTCDRRSSCSSITSRWPDYEIEKGFTEKDELWRPDLRESFTALIERARCALDDIFAHDNSTLISLTAHSGTIAGTLRAVGHRQFSLQTGGVIPVLLKVEIVKGKRPEAHVDPWQPKPECKGEDHHKKRAVSYDEYIHLPESLAHV